MIKHDAFLLLSLFFFAPVQAQKSNVANLQLPQVGDPVISEPVDGVVGHSTRASVEPMYDYPAGLSCLGTHSSEEEPVCNYLSPNKNFNGDHFLWAPTGKKVNYVNTTQGSATGYNWTLPGTNEGTATTEDASVTYTQLGHYPFPTLECSDAGGGKATYQAEGEILVSGRAEITTANCRKWGELDAGGTYRLGSFPLNGGAGFVGGTNSAGLSGFGNLFMTSHSNAYMTGVNVYFAAMPTKYEQGQQLLLRVWYPTEGEDGNLQLDGLPLEAVFLPVSEIRKARDGEISVKNAAVAEFRFEEPLQIWDKPLFFVTVEGFGTDPSKADICMLAEVNGQSIPEEHLSNLLAHNSLVSYGGMGYTVPVNYFGTMPGASFMICPIIDNGDGDPTGIESVVAEENGETNVSINGNELSVENVEGTGVKVFDLCGMAVAESTMSGGRAVVSLPGHGVYLVKVACRNGGTDVRKVMVGR